MGRGIHMVRARVRARMGARINIEIEGPILTPQHLSFSYLPSAWMSTPMDLTHLVNAPPYFACAMDTCC